jgi:hypothetical protein
MDINLIKDSRILDKIDLFILSACFDELLDWNLSYIDTNNFYHRFDIKGVFIPKEYFIWRIFYLIWLWLLEAEPIPDLKSLELKCKNSKLDISSITDDKWGKLSINDKKYHKHFLSCKITTDWILRQEKLYDNIDSTIWLKWLYNFAKSHIELMLKYKFVAVFSFTAILTIMIFAFDIKVTAYLDKLPLVSSIVDIDLLKQFENVNENDDYYKQMKQQLVGANTWRTLDSMDIKEIKVRTVSTNEKMFRVILKNWDEQYIPVKKSADWRFDIKIPELIRQRIEFFKKNFQKIRN